MAGVEQNPGPAQESRIRQLYVGLINAQSIVHKAALIHDVIKDNSLDLLAVTETWVYNHSPDVHKQEAVPAGYSIVHAHRQPSPGSDEVREGGVAIIHREEIHMKLVPINLDSTKSFELLLVKLVNVKPSLSLAVIYRPQRESRGKHFSVSDFTSELADLLDVGC